MEQGGKSWTAYVVTIVIGLVLILLITPAVWGASTLGGALALVAFLAFIVYRILYIKSYNLNYDKSGIWIRYGIFPWDKRAYGVKWRDLDGALCYPTFTSWLFKSYSIRLTHRFTKSGEIAVSEVAHGHSVVGAINARHQDLVRGNALN